MKGRIGKYKDKIVVWGDQNLTAKNEINIDSLDGGGEGQTGNSEPMNYYILKEDLDFSLSSEDFRTEIYNKTKDKTIIALINTTDDSVLIERVRKSFLDVKLINDKGTEKDPLMVVIQLYYHPLHEIILLDTYKNPDTDHLNISNNNRYIYVGYKDNHMVIGGNVPTSNGRINGILCFSTPKVVQLCHTDDTKCLTGQLINPIEALYDEEILNTWFKKVSFAEYNEFTKKILLKAFG